MKQKRNVLMQDSDLLIELLAEQKVLSDKLAMITCPQLAEKFDVNLMQVCRFRDRHQEQINNRAREMVGK